MIIKKKNIVLLTLMLLLFFNCIFAQEQTDLNNKKERRIYFKVYYSPSYSFLNAYSKTTKIKISNSYENWSTYEFDSKDEIGCYGFDLGLLLEFKLQKHISISSGITYERINFKTKDFTLIKYGYFDYAWIPREGIADNINLNQSYSFISIPLIIKYTLKKKRTNYSIGIGASYDLLSNYNTLISYNSNTTSSFFYLYDYTPLTRTHIDYFSFISTLGFGFCLNKRLEIGIEPYFRYSFFNLNNKTNTINAENVGFVKSNKLISVGSNIYLKF